MQPLRVTTTFAVLVWAVSASGSVPSLDETSGYEGTVSEAGGRVDLSPPLTASGGPICGYRLVNLHKGNLPFEVMMLDQSTGSAEVRVKSRLDCETRRNYKLEIVAVACSGQLSNRARLDVTVKDVNEFSPAWSQDEYSAELAEGHIKDEILRVHATDPDCSPSFGTVCGYTITSPDQPFRIDEQGRISNTSPLDSQESRSHVLSVEAQDCGGKVSSPVLVTISVLPKCITSWTDVSTSMTYIPGTGPQPVFPQARLLLCPAAVCKATKLETSLTLHTDHVGVGCDRDTYSLASQRKMCGASSSAIDLLPANSGEAAWVTHLNADKGREASPVYRFDGATAATVPEEVLPHNLGKEFTISTWMRHEAKSINKHAKEHVLCLADDVRKNRHHLSLFVRNCKLVLLSRREYVEEERNTFKPAEWRWTLPQVCDDKWHHYAVSVFPEGVELTLDGELWQAETNNPEVIDDWSLHPAADLKTTFAVGGCWHGNEGKMKHHLKGYLAGLAVLPGKREHAEVLKCLVQCSESLQLPATNLLDPGMEMITNSHGSQVTIDGKDPKNMEELVRQVAYLNTREFPAPGRRRLELTTTITCQDGTVRDVPEAVSRILVLPVPQPTISLEATKNISRGYEDFKDGVRVFADVRISMSRSTEGVEVDSEEPRLDKCSISVFPPLNPDHEKVQLPTSMLRSLNIVGNLNEGGAEIMGADAIYNYEQVLRQVVYSNQKPAYYLNRQFKLVCSELNERFTSNEYMQTLTVIHPPPVYSERVEEARPAHLQADSGHGADQGGPRFLSTRQYLTLTGQAQGHAVVVVVAVCVCLLVAVLGLGVVRLRAAHRRAAAEEAEVEMAWDDTALNITVNPLEDAECRAMGGARPTESDLDESSDDDLYASSDEDDEDEEEEEMDGAPSRHRLEWDNDL